jgi:hypothetical protein
VLFLVGFILPHGGFDTAEAEGLHRDLGAGGSGFGLRGGLSGFCGHDVPFLFLRSGIALSSKGGGAGRNEEMVGGIPSKEDPNALRPRSGVPVGGTARESKNAPVKKGRSAAADMPATALTTRSRDRVSARTLPVMLLHRPLRRVGERSDGKFSVNAPDRRG